MKGIAVFASGNGTNCENIIKYFSQSTIAKVNLVVSNNANSKVVERAKNLGVDVRIIGKEDLKNNNLVLKLLEEYNISYIVLAGFLLFIPEFLIEAFKNKIVNIHPSLLPKYGGKGMYGMNVHEAVRRNNEKESGITIHIVNNEYDKGNIIAQFTTPLSATDTANDISAKVHELEYAYYPKVIEKLIKEE